MNRIVIGYPSGLAGRLLTESHKKNFPKSHIINPLLTKLVRSRWLNIGLFFFACVFMDRYGVEVHKHAKEYQLKKKTNNHPGYSKMVLLILSNSNWMEWSIIQGVIARFS